MLTCASRYNCFVIDSIYGSVSHIINSHASRLISDDMLGCATFLRQLIMITDGFLNLSNGPALSTDEVKDIIFLHMHELIGCLI